MFIECSEKASQKKKNQICLLYNLWNGEKGRSFWARKYRNGLAEKMVMLHMNDYTKKYSGK